MHRRRFTLLTVAAAALTAVVTVNAPTEAAKAPLRYVALGDS
jgi:hypothetical protein